MTETINTVTTSVVVVVAVVVVTSTVSVFVSVVLRVMIGGVKVMLALIIGVDVVVLKIVTVLVTESVTGVCKQEHTRAMSETGRDKILVKMLAADSALGRLLCKAAGVLDTVVVLRLCFSMLTFDPHVGEQLTSLLYLFLSPPSGRNWSQ